MSNDWSELRKRCRELALALGLPAKELPDPRLSYRELEVYWMRLIDRTERVRRARARDTEAGVVLSGT